jgi:hypothetical protein
MLCRGDRLDPVQGFELVNAHRATHRVATLRRVPEVSSSGGSGPCRRAPGPTSP